MAISLCSDKVAGFPPSLLASTAMATATATRYHTEIKYIQMKRHGVVNGHLMAEYFFGCEHR